MKELKIEPMAPDSKLVFPVTGMLALPLHTGERAFILLPSGNSMITSVVKAILEVSCSGVKFETGRRIYDLRYETSARPEEVMCA